MCLGSPPPTCALTSVAILMRAARAFQAKKGSYESKRKNVRTKASARRLVQVLFEKALACWFWKLVRVISAPFNNHRAISACACAYAASAKVGCGAGHKAVSVVGAHQPYQFPEPNSSLLK